MVQHLAILSPEKAVLQYRLATVASRVLAFFLDLCIFFALFLTLLFLAAILSGFGALPTGLFTSFALIGASLGPFIYFILFEGFWNGQTLGKKALGIRVKMVDGTPVTFFAAIGRNLLLPADLMPGTGFAGLMAMFLNRNCQRLGDLASRTIVVYERRPEPYFAVAPHTVGRHPLEAQVGDLSRMTLDEYIALRRLTDRFPELPRKVQTEMMRQVWIPLAARHSIPTFPQIDPIYVAEAVVMRYGRIHGLL